MYLCYKVLLPISLICAVGLALQVLIALTTLGPEHALGAWLGGK